MSKIEESRAKSRAPRRRKRIEVCSELQDDFDRWEARERFIHLCSGLPYPPKARRK